MWFSRMARLQLQYERAKRGITLAVSAGGGELYRDHFWLQDLPFYSRKKANLQRFCSLRLLPTDPKQTYLGPDFRDASRGYRSRLMRDLAQYEVPGNTQTYDWFIYRVRYRELLGRYVTNHTNVLRCYTPFMERDGVMFGYQMPRFDRFFDYLLPQDGHQVSTRSSAYPHDSRQCELVFRIFATGSRRIQVLRRQDHTNFATCRTKILWASVTSPAESSTNRWAIPAALPCSGDRRSWNRPFQD